MMRPFKPDPVPDHLLKTVWEADIVAPSRGNTQILRFSVIKDLAYWLASGKICPQSRVPLVDVLCQISGALRGPFTS
jgi:nitroreductase